MYLKIFLIFKCVACPEKIACFSSVINVNEVRSSDLNSAAFKIRDNGTFEIWHDEGEFELELFSCSNIDGCWMRWFHYKIKK